MKSLSKGAKITLDVLLIVLLVIFFVASEMTFVNEVKQFLTETVEVADGKTSPSVKHNLILSKSGKTQFFAKWWPEEDLGFITAVILRDMNNDVRFYSTGNKLECWSEEMRLEKGTYEVELVFFGNESDFKGFFENMGVDTSDWEVTDCFVDGSYTVDFNYGLKGNGPIFDGIAIVILVFIMIIASHLAIVITTSSGESKAYYDERQLLARGQASTASTYAMLAYFGVCFFLKLSDIDVALPDTVMILAGIIIGVVVLATLCIWNGAYIALNQNPKATIGMLSIIMIINVFGGIINFTNAFKHNDPAVTVINENLSFTSGLFNLMMALTMLYVIIIYVVRMRLDARED